MRPDFCSRRSFLGAAAAGGLALTFGKCLAAPDALLI
ncbi:MAG: twin-arginine translocation signal domain-containing protein, partial [Thermogutta sp.]|nr:twin-arginine translocation signal domain-containing protein [Thermogutta sp.]